MGNRKNSDIEEILMLKVCYRFLEGKGLPEKMKKGERYFELTKNEQEAQEFCNKFEEMFSKKLNYKIFKGNAYFEYDIVTNAIRKANQGLYAPKRSGEL